MKNKFQIRPIYDVFDREIPAGWLVIAPNGASEQIDHFSEAIRIFDLWLEETRCHIVTREKRSRANKATEIAGA